MRLPFVSRATYEADRRLWIALVDRASANETAARNDYRALAQHVAELAVQRPAPAPAPPPPEPALTGPSLGMQTSAAIAAEARGRPDVAKALRSEALALVAKGFDDARIAGLLLKGDRVTDD